MTKTHISFSHRHPSMFPNRNIRKKKGVHTVPNLDFWSKNSIVGKLKNQSKMLLFFKLGGSRVPKSGCRLD